MKTISLMFIITFFASLMFSQESRLDSVLGIKWGASNKEVMKIMLKRKNVKYLKYQSQFNNLVFSGGTYAGQDVYNWQFLIEPKLGFFALTVRFFVSVDNAVGKYRELKDIITKKYFPPSSSIEKLESPYSDDASYESQAISAGKATFSSRWTFQDTEKDVNFIILEINLAKKILGVYRTVNVNYYNGFIFNKVNSQFEEDKLKDF